MSWMLVRLQKHEGLADFYEPYMNYEISLMQKFTSLSEHKDNKSHCLCYTALMEWACVCVRGELEMSVMRSMKFVIGKKATREEAQGLHDIGDNCLEEDEEWFSCFDE